ncbi:hypothetical protein LXL04_018009 [Taraxacum kok-saghyz]
MFIVSEFYVYDVLCFPYNQIIFCFVFMFKVILDSIDDGLILIKPKEKAKGKDAFYIIKVLPCGAYMTLLYPDLSSMSGFFFVEGPTSLSLLLGSISFDLELLDFVDAFHVEIIFVFKIWNTDKQIWKRAKITNGISTRKKKAYVGCGREKRKKKGNKARRKCRSKGAGKSTNRWQSSKVQIQSKDQN